MPSKSRSELHLQLSSHLAGYSDSALSALLQKATPMHEGVGGSSSLFEIDGHKVFAKKIPLTDLERSSENFLSTANLFHLPMFYQYRLGSAGFGAWRELAAHKLTTEWALSGKCSNFPLLFHWRVVECDKPHTMTAREVEDLNIAVEYWDDSQAVRQRLEGLHGASAHLVLFLQYIPLTLHDWLSFELNKDSASADSAVTLVENQFALVSSFFRDNGFVHFDAHFNNILCDGNLYYGDFGLALSSQFDLGQEEKDFLQRHHSYDRAVCIVSLIQSLMLCFYGKGRWLEHLTAICANDQIMTEKLTPLIESTIRRNAPIAFVLSDFYQQLQNETKSAVYPAKEIEQLLKEIDDGNN
ncbi:protein kinase family protein [bacterium]|nr:protein kinase family protein [bacterium]